MIILIKLNFRPGLLE